jgi:outer membrane murein-binding lipoprotein Lpp
LKGKASESAIQQRVAQRVRELNTQRARLMDDYTQVYDIYNADKQEAMQLLNMRIADQQQAEARQWKVFEQKYSITQKAFETQWNLATRDIDRQEKMYWSKKDMEDKMKQWYLRRN